MIATKTLAKIETALTADQGESFRRLLAKYLPQANDIYNTPSGRRSHLGASILGSNCARAVWYSFRWCTDEVLPGRLIRLFNRGHMEEPRFLALLEMIDCEVWAVGADGKQLNVASSDDHSAGSLDCVLRGIPEMPTTAILGEFKTHGEKSFLKLKEDGVMNSKWEHFVQMNFYMGMMKLPAALYCAVNKNTDELHMEIVRYDPTNYLESLQKAKYISYVEGPPNRISLDATWWQCKYCKHHPVCHKQAQPAQNCRTCRHVGVNKDGWFCNNYQVSGHRWLDREQQEYGCEYYSTNRLFNS